MNRAKIGIVGLLIVALALPGCITASAFFGKVAPPREQVLRYWNAAEPRSIDPHKTAGIPENNIMLNIFETLTTYDPKTLEPRPGIAESWEALDGARTWIFHLRKNAIWIDKHPVTAQDFVYAWQRAVTPATAAPYVSLQYYVRNGEAISNGKMPPSALGVRAVDDYTLEVQMERPTAFFAKMTPHYIFAPLPHWAIEKWGDKWTDPDKIVTNGPFKLVEHKPYDQITLVKNPDYWDVANVKLDKVIVIPIEDNSTGINLYKAGEVYAMQSNSIPLPFIKALKTKKDYVQGTFFTTYYFSFNVKKKPFDNVLVRRALNMATNKKAIAEDLLGRGDIPATSLVPPGIAGYPELKGDEYNVAQAKSLLAEAGYPDGKGFPTITIYFNTLDTHRQIAEAIQRMWKETLNIRVELQNEEWQTFQARRERRDFDVARDAWTGDYLDPNTFLDLFASESLNNHTGWTNEEYSRLIDAANSEADTAKRTELMVKAEKMLNDEMPIVPLYFYALCYLKKPFVEGWHKNLLDIHPLKYVSIREDWTAENSVNWQREREEDQAQELNDRPGRYWQPGR
jgi:ABC-type oligopeptide transport system substrate-binding subunit